MNFEIVIPVLISFAISLILGPIIIPFLRKLKMGQTERVEGVQSHLKKAGTPTMGGIIFLLAAVITSVFYVKDYPSVIPVLFLTLGFGIIGSLSGSWLAGDPGYVFCSDRNGKRCKLYRWTGRTGIQCYADRGSIFYSGIYRYQKWH